MSGTPGAMTAFSTAERKGMYKPETYTAGPADYNVTTKTIVKRPETVAPFDTSEIRGKPKFTYAPGPAAYSPDKPIRDYRGSPLYLPDHFPAHLRRGSRSVGPGPAAVNIMGQFDKMAQDAQIMKTKRPRVQYEKNISNACPSVFHPRDIRCFVEGVDGRMYPWKMLQNKGGPGPKYNVTGIETSVSKRVPIIDFGNGAKRPDFIKVQPGFGPADFNTRLAFNPNGGVMLSKTSDPKQSDKRLFEILRRKTIKDHIPTPFAHSIIRFCDRESPQAVSAPFKSKTKMAGQVSTAKPGPGPADHFKPNISLTSVSSPKIFAITTKPPTIKSFNTTEPRFFNMADNEYESKPGPDAYTIRGFTDELIYKLSRHRAGKRNPKEGFLVSAEARDDKVFKQLFGEEVIISKGSPRRYWRNLRPKKGDSYPYNGAPYKYPDSPGPIYDTNPGCEAIKGKKSWNDPRRWLHSTAFLVSGCNREVGMGHIDKNNPGPARYYPKFQPTSGGKLSTGGKRFPKRTRVGPGPCHKLHEKFDSSMWRASHLGTFNTKLKQIGVSHPSSGGFRAKVIDQAGDKAWRIKRLDDYEEILSNPIQTRCLKSILRVMKHGPCDV